MTVEFEMVGIAVADMGKSLEFYRLLGLNIPEGSEKEQHVEIPVNGSGWRGIPLKCSRVYMAKWSRLQVSESS